MNAPACRRAPPSTGTLAFCAAAAADGTRAISAGLRRENGGLFAPPISLSSSSSPSSGTGTICVPPPYPYPPPRVDSGAALSFTMLTRGMRARRAALRGDSRSRPAPEAGEGVAGMSSSASA